MQNCLLKLARSAYIILLCLANFNPQLLMGGNLKSHHHAPTPYRHHFLAVTKKLLITNIWLTGYYRVTRFIVVRKIIVVKGLNLTSFLMWRVFNSSMRLISESLVGTVELEELNKKSSKRRGRVSTCSWTSGNTRPVRYKRGGECPGQPLISRRSNLVGRPWSLSGASTEQPIWSEWAPTIHSAWPKLIQLGRDLRSWADGSSRCGLSADISTVRLIYSLRCLS